jgi:hypothetical protein
VTAASRADARDAVTLAQRRAAQIVADARARAESLERDAIERHRDKLGSLAGSREELDRRVEDLRVFEREYRYRLRAYLTGLLDDLNQRDPCERPRTEMIGPEWTVIAPGLEVRATGNGLVGRVVIEVREAVTP